MERYDPLKAPDPQEWLSLDEQERLDLVEDYHRRAHIDLPNEKAHAIAHAIVENQIALGEELNVERTLRRLMAEGLDRHDAIHAIGMVCVELLHDALQRPKSKTFPSEKYAAALDRLTAEDWRRSADDPEVAAAGDATIEEEQRWSPSGPAVNPFKSVGRNDPCPCGSGKKFKKCCLK
jgi:SEC-C motif